MGRARAVWPWLKDLRRHRPRRRRIAAAIEDAYRRLPQTGDELAGLDDATRALVGEEPW